MKLIYCPECEDVVRLRRNLRYCECGESCGIYITKVQAEIYGEAIPLGFDNNSFDKALRKRPKDGDGKKFVAFVIPKRCPTVSAFPTAECEGGG